MILVTGGAGYIGSHCAVNFINAGYDVVIFDSLENGHIETIDALKKLGNVEFVKGDLRKFSEIEAVFAEYKIDAVIHFAAFALVEESVKDPAKYYRNNTFGTLNLLDAMLQHGVKNIIFSSTCATYGEPQYTPIDEKHPQNPVNPYGNSKLMVEKILEDYNSAYGIKSIKLRYFNVAGADAEARIGEWHEPETHLIPNIIKSVFNDNVKFKIFGENYPTPDGSAIRDYVNVEDLAEAHRLAYLYLLKEEKSDVFNLGTSDGNSVKEVFKVCKDVLKQNIDCEICPPREGDPAILYANSEKAKNILGWTPQRTLETSIENAYEWEKNLQARLKLHIDCR